MMILAAIDMNLMHALPVIPTGVKMTESLKFVGRHAGERMRDSAVKMPRTVLPHPLRA